MNSYPAGNQIVLTSTFTIAATGAVANPTAVKVRVTDPLGSETDYTGGQLSNPSTGVFTVTITVTTPGVWNYRAEGTGAVFAAQEGQFVVRRSPFANPG